MALYLDSSALVKLVAVEAESDKIAAARRQLGAEDVEARHRYRLVRCAVGGEHGRTAREQTLQSGRLQERRPAPVRMAQPELVGVVRIGQHRGPALMDLFHTVLGVASPVGFPGLRRQR